MYSAWTVHEYCCIQMIINAKYIHKVALSVLPLITRPLVQLVQCAVCLGQHRILMVGVGNARNAASTREFGHNIATLIHLQCNKHVASIHSKRILVHLISGQKLPMAVSEKDSKIGGICLAHTCSL